MATTEPGVHPSLFCLDNSIRITGIMMMKKTLAGLVLAVVSLSMSGCAKYYMVESSYVVSDLKEQPSQVTRSSRAPDLSMLRTVAVKAPDLCINESQSQKTGESKGNAQVMKVQCGVEMAQIESALARAGFAVISWKMKTRNIREEKE